MKQAAFDEEGYLVDPLDWNENIARDLAQNEGIELDPIVWDIISFMRDYWSRQHITPDVRHVVAHLVAERDMDKKAAKARLFELFPYGYVKQACKIAGMQRPRAWSTG
ncbi:MAG: sulfurtransferase TusE [marine bacterium B5-7]|nr:MAG: sulfurtransferase TusE [marine bacterium B5-7]